ncbi:hypothetical protein MRGA327_09785 [Mycobacterium tuberculosis RGTB327]|nr:hypothetical protein MRGA327_09785 [Mycobacterium tuberculosis RGTB327]
MSRTNIDIDDELAAEVMRRFGLTTKRAAVDLALRRLVGSPLRARRFSARAGRRRLGRRPRMTLRSDRPD